jgi:hypothetical protein
LRLLLFPCAIIGHRDQFDFKHAYESLMDFIDWCHCVLRTLEDERYHSHLDTHQLQSILFGPAAEQPNFHFSDQRHGMFHALTALADAGLAEEGKHNKWKITPFGREVLANPVPYWAEICAQEIDSEEAAVLHLVNKLSPQKGPARIVLG